MAIDRKTLKKGRKPQNSTALIVGAGMGGIRAAFDLAEAGKQVILLDYQPNIGGVLMQLDRQFPTNDCGICKMLPTIMRDDISECCLRRNLTHPNISVLTNSKVKKVSGKVGDFSIEIQQKPLYVDPKKCITCGKCEQVCPVEVPNEFNDNLDNRKAVYQPYPLPNPNTYTLDIESCTNCGKCLDVCPTNAIDLQAKEHDLTYSVGTIILSPGLRVLDPTPYEPYGYGSNPNILTSIDFERIYSGVGPYTGERKLTRPSDQRQPKNIAFIQCVGSRNAQFGHEYCSYACCMYSLKEAMMVKEQNPEIDVTIFYMDMRTFGKGYHEYYQKAKEMGINFIRCRVPEVGSIPDTNNLELTLVTESGKISTEEFELVVLSVGLEASEGVRELSEVFGVTLDDNNFSVHDEFSPLLTNVPGIYACGAFTGPKDIPETVTEASAAAALAGSNISTFEPEMENDENKAGAEDTDIRSNITTTVNDPLKVNQTPIPSVGIILCTCGDDISSRIDIKAVEEFASALPGVALVTQVDFLCLKPEEIQNIIAGAATKINRLLIAACTPYQFETKFRKYSSAAGINSEHMELYNFREGTVWVGSDDKDLTTANVTRHLAIAVEKLTGMNTMIMKTASPVSHKGLVIGGGVAGMASAVTLANNGYAVDLIEHSESLGGNSLDIYGTLEHDDSQNLIQSVIHDVDTNKNINVHLNSSIRDLSGHVGSFHASIIDRNNEKAEAEGEYGAIILASGAKPYEPKKGEFMYGESPFVLTQTDLEMMLAGKSLDKENKEMMKLFHESSGSKLPTIAMIQCVGSRNSEHPYCSRVCCGKAIKNALKIKNKYPKSKIYIIYQEIMTYGLQEKYYLAARNAGVEFIRYESEMPPLVSINNTTGNPRITLQDVLLDQKIILEPNLVVLSTGIVPTPEKLEIFDDFGLEYTTTNFVKEANVKFRPVDVLTDGIFIAGLVHSPRQLSEAIIQGQAAAGRAISILSKLTIPVRREVSIVNKRKCSGCEACVTACPYHARVIEPDEKVAVVIEPLCQACGACAMVCPNAAAILPSLNRKQVYSMIDSAVYL